MKLNLKIPVNFVSSIKFYTRLLVFGLACFGLGTIFAMNYVQTQQSALLSTKIVDLEAQTNRLVDFELYMLEYKQDLDARLSEYTSRFTRIEHLMHIPRYRRAEADDGE